MTSSTNTESFECCLRSIADALRGLLVEMQTVVVSLNISFG